MREKITPAKKKVSPDVGGRWKGIRGEKEKGREMAEIIGQTYTFQVVWMDCILKGCLQWFLILAAHQNYLGSF